MSILSLLKRGRAQAKEQNAKKAEEAEKEKEKGESGKVPYKHVVTHAYTDALPGSPENWRDLDRLKIIEINKRRNAMLENQANANLMPRVRSTPFPGTHAAVYRTPVVPLPKNYSFYNVPPAWRDQLATSQDALDFLDQHDPARNAKGKQREYIQPSSPNAPFSGLSSGSSSIIPSRGASRNGSSAQLSNYDDELGAKGKAVDHHPNNTSYRSTPSQQSSEPSSEPHPAPLTSSRITAEMLAKHDRERYYPPLTQNNYFSAPRPMNRRTSSAATSTLSISTVVGQASSAISPSITSGHFSDDSSVTSIGIAITPPHPPYLKELPPASALADDLISSEKKYGNTTHPGNAPIQTRQARSARQHDVSAEIAAANPDDQNITPPPREQRRRRRLSKARPPSSEESRIRMSVDTIRPTRTSTTITTTATDDSDQMGYATDERGRTSSVPTGKSVKTAESSSNDTEPKHNQRKLRIFRIRSKPPAITAH